MTDVNPVFRDDTDRGAYVVEIEGAGVGKALYHLRGGQHFFVHTEIRPEYSGMGLGNRLVRFALDDVRSKGGVVVPICPLFAAYIQSHPEYGDLVDREIMDRIERNAEGRGDSA